MDPLSVEKFSPFIFSEKKKHKVVSATLERVQKYCNVYTVSLNTLFINHHLGDGERRLWTVKAERGFVGRGHIKELGGLRELRKEIQ